MRIEERCPCGAEFVLVVDLERYSLSASREEDARAWTQVDRWRKIHRECHKVFANWRTPEAIATGLTIPLQPFDH